MANRIFHKLSFAQKLLLAMAALGAVAGPIAAGLAGPPRSQSQAQTVAAAPRIATFLQAPGAPALPAAPAKSVEPTSTGGGLVASHPAFDAASVKLNGGELLIPGAFRMRGGPGTGSPGRITFTQVSLPQVLMKAWNLRDYQLVGPAWFKEGGMNDRYTIMATMPPETTKQQFQLMLQDLLVERFRMEFHRETRKVAGYDLVVAQGGPKLKESSDPDAPEPTTGPPTGADKGGFPLLPPGHGAGVVAVNGTHAKFQNYTMAEFADGYLNFFVSGAIGHGPVPIRDKTGLTGKYDFTLVFDSRGGRVFGPAVSTATPPPAGSGGEIPTTGPATDPSGLPDIFNAVEKQLGLKLVTVKEIPLDVLVIDHIEKVPVEN